MSLPPKRYFFYFAVCYLVLSQLWSSLFAPSVSFVSVPPLEQLSTNATPTTAPVYKADPFLTWKQDHWTPPRYPSSFDMASGHVDSFLQRVQTYQQMGHNRSELEQWQSAVTMHTTVIVHAIDKPALEKQLAAIARQSAAIDTTWIVCSRALKPTVDILVVQFPSLNIHVHAAAPNTEAKPGSAAASPWLSAIAKLNIQSDFIWVLDDGAVPTDHYLDTMLPFIAPNDSPYAQTLLGTHGALLPANAFVTKYKPAIHCLPAAFHFLPDVVQPVDMVHHSWVLRRAWLQHLLPENDDLLASPLAFYISQSLAPHGIPSMVLPPPKTLKNTRKVPVAALRGLRTAVACAHVVPRAYEQDDAWRRVLAMRATPTAVDMRFRALTPSYKPLLFLIHDVNEAKAIFPLICRFPAHVPIHVALPGISQGLDAATWGPHLTRECHRPFILHDMHLPANDRRHGQLMAQLGRLAHAIQPAVFFHLSDSIFFDDVQALMQLQTRVTPCTVIHLPHDQVPHALWLSKLSVQALQHWNDIKVNLVVITDRRPHSLSRLLNSVRQANYLGDAVDLTIHMDQTADRVTRMLVHNFAWEHGVKHVRHRIRKGGLMPAIVESWYPSTNDDYGVLLEDDIEVSLLFYAWIKYTILHYRYDPEYNQGRSWIYGISLYSPRNLELRPEGRIAFDPNQVLIPGGFPRNTPYASQVPCSWGAVYFPEHWREFHQYLNTRLQDLAAPTPLLNTTVPRSRSNRWKKSWKKYFIELVYLRGYVMVYPNFQDFESFSTNHLEFGTHIKHTRAKSAVASFVVPLMKDDTIYSQLPAHRLPSFDHLPMLDLWGHLHTHSQLYITGVHWQRHVSACAPPSFVRFDPQDLVCPFDDALEAADAAEAEAEQLEAAVQGTGVVIAADAAVTTTSKAKKPKKKKKKVISTELFEYVEYKTIYVNDEAAQMDDMDSAWADLPEPLDVASMRTASDDHHYEDQEYKDLEHNLDALVTIAKQQMA
ncbi:hypothetical protein BC940DRAFT_349628 [Gongronella butleri]|nr:hypothetical protein BC940DRAFT_349628 [Gongronella butleri]